MQKGSKFGGSLHHTISHCMAKEEVIKKVIVSVTLDSDKIEQSARLNSTEVTPKSSQSLLSRNETLLPRYLRPPASSCHDLCKFGKKYVDETKKRDTNFLKFSSRIEIRKDEQAGVSTSQERRQWPELKLKKTTLHPKDETFDKPGGKQSFRASESRKLETPSVESEQLHEELETSEIIKLKGCLSAEKRVISHEPLTPPARSEGSSGSACMELESPSDIHMLMKPADQPAMSKSTALPSEFKTVKSVVSSLTRKSTASEKASSMNLKTLTFARNSGVGLATKERIPVKSLKTESSSKNELSDKAKAIREKRIELPGKNAILGRRKTYEQKSPISVEKVISVSPRVIKQKTSVNNIKRIEAPTRSSIPSRSRTPSVISASSVDTNQGKSSINKLKPSSAFISSNPRVDGDRTSLNLRNHSSSKTSPTPGKRNPDTDDKVKEKTLYVIESNLVKPEPNTVKKEYRRRSCSSSFSSTASSFESTLSEVSDLVKKKSVRSPKLPSPQKKKFQRGKVVSPESVPYAPRKLKFRQVKGEGVKSNKEVKKRFLRKRKGSGGSASELVTPSCSKAPAVILRHQDVSEKKDTPTVNFNDVIEETASKLVETRKSKVKALVGAFESIISLQ